MKSQKSFAVTILIVLTAVSFKCTNNDLRNPENLLISRINERLKNKDYVTNRVANPFDDLGKEVEKFRKEFSAATQARKVKGKSFPQSRTAYASFFTFASNTKYSWGFDDAAEFDFAKEYIDTYFEGKGYSYDPARLIPINDNLTKYSRNIDGIGNGRRCLR